MKNKVIRIVMLVLLALGICWNQQLFAQAKETKEAEKRDTIYASHPAETLLRSIRNINRCRNT